MRDYGILYTNDKTGEITAFDGRTFPSMAALEKFAGMADAYALRAVSARELASPHGIHKYPTPWAVADANWKPPTKPVESGANVYEDPQVLEYAQHLKSRQGGAIDRHKLYAQASKELKAREKSEAEQAAEAEKREPTIRAARAYLDRVRFSTDATIEELQLAIRAHIAAKTLDADAHIAKEMLSQGLDLETARNNEKQRLLRDKIAELQSQLDDRPLPEPPKPAAPAPPSEDRVERMRKSLGPRATVEEARYFLETLDRERGQST